MVEMVMRQNDRIDVFRSEAESFKAFLYFLTRIFRARVYDDVHLSGQDQGCRGFDLAVNMVAGVQAVHMDF
jgi:hypothetical protein